MTPENCHEIKKMFGARFWSKTEKQILCQNPAVLDKTTFLSIQCTKMHSLEKDDVFLNWFKIYQKRIAWWQINLTQCFIITFAVSTHFTFHVSLFVLSMLYLHFNSKMFWDTTSIINLTCFGLWLILLLDCIRWDICFRWLLNVEVSCRFLFPCL